MGGVRGRCAKGRCGGGEERGRYGSGYVEVWVMMGGVGGGMGGVWYGQLKFL